jgi:hypothetical protein
MTTFNVTWQASETTDEVGANTLAQHQTGLTLAEALDVAQACGASGKLTDDAGFTKGWVHADRSWTLT